MKKVSIIVPVYHVEKYLEKCVDSILDQSYPELEIILVDDGGDDSCPSICDSYCRKDSRVKCIHKKNEGQSMARKAGLLKSTGQYVMYVDADDWLKENTVSECVLTAEKNRADVVCFGYQRVYPHKVFDTSLFERDQLFEGAQTGYLHRRMIGLLGKELEYIEEADRLVPMWGKLYTREAAFRGVFISERCVGSSEDAIYNLSVFENCKKCVYIHQFLYCYRKADENTTTTTYREELPKQWERLFDYFDSYISEKALEREYEEALQNRIALGILGLGMNELRNPESFLKKAKNLRKILQTQRWQKAYSCLEFQYLPLKWKIFYGLCKYQQTELLLCMLWMISRLKSVISR